MEKIRKSLDLTQQEFADRIGIKRNSYANYEIGRNIPIDAIILSICREFNVNEDWLRNGGSDENMFIKLTEDEELAMYTQILLDSTDDIMADMIKDFIEKYNLTALDEYDLVASGHIFLRIIDNLVIAYMPSSLTDLQYERLLEKRELLEEFPCFSANFFNNINFLSNLSNPCHSNRDYPIIINH